MHCWGQRSRRVTLGQPAVTLYENAKYHFFKEPLNNDIFMHMSKRDYLHRKATRSNDDSDWKVYKEYRNKVTAMIRKSKENYFKVNINNCNGDSGRLWKTLKNVLPKKPSSNFGMNWNL